MSSFQKIEASYSYAQLPRVGLGNMLFRELADHRESLIDKESRNIPIDGMGEKRPPGGQLGSSLLVARKERLQLFGAIPI